MRHGDIYIYPPKSGPICDFCSHPHIFKSYSAPDFELKEMPPIGGYGWASMGSWAACRECSRLIDASHWQELENRAVHSFIKKNPEVRIDQASLRDYIRKLHTKFRELRTRNES